MDGYGLVAPVVQLIFMLKIAEKQQKPSAIALTRAAEKRKNYILLKELEVLIQSSDVKMAALKRVNALREEEKKF
jgi:hypothetical protein